MLYSLFINVLTMRAKSKNKYPFYIAHLKVSNPDENNLSLINCYICFKMLLDSFSVHYIPIHTLTLWHIQCTSGGGTGTGATAMPRLDSVFEVAFKAL